jgi:hypothetical protein
MLPKQLKYSTFSCFCSIITCTGYHCLDILNTLVLCILISKYTASSTFNWLNQSRPVAQGNLRIAQGADFRIQFKCHRKHRFWNSGFPGGYALSFGNWSLAFRGISVPSFSGSKRRLESSAAPLWKPEISHKTLSFAKIKRLMVFREIIAMFW